MKEKVSFQFKTFDARSLYVLPKAEAPKKNNTRTIYGEFIVKVILSVNGGRRNKIKEIQEISDGVMESVLQDLNNLYDSYKEETLNQNNKIAKLSSGVEVSDPDKDNFGEITIPVSLISPAVIRFIEVFSEYDNSLYALVNRLHRGHINKRDYYKIRKTISKPIKRFMQEMLIKSKTYHSVKNEIINLDKINL